MSNYAWNRTWTFRTSGASVFGQGRVRPVVSGLSLGANQLFAIVLATPFSFGTSKLWAFAEDAPVTDSEAVPVVVRRDS